MKHPLAYLTIILTLLQYGLVRSESHQVAKRRHGASVTPRQCPWLHSSTSSPSADGPEGCAPYYSSVEQVVQKRGGARSSKIATHSAPAWWNGCKSGLASALSAACSKIVLHPLDAIKTVQQVSLSSSSAAANAASVQKISLLGACNELMRRPGGISNFYSGLGVAAIGSMPGVGIYFGVYSFCKQRFLRQTNANGERSFHPLLAVAMSAAVGNTVASFSRVPYEVVKQQLQTGQYATTRQALTSILTSPDWLSKVFPPGGVSSQMLRDVPYAIVTLVCYEYLQWAASGVKRTSGKVKSETRRNAEHKAVPSFITLPPRTWDFIIGGTAGGFGSLVTNPFDVIKTRLQTDPMGTASLYQGSISKCARLALEEGGLATFMRGSIPRLAHKVPANAFFFLFYEGFRRLLRVEDSSGESSKPRAVSDKEK